MRAEAKYTCKLSVTSSVICFATQNQGFSIRFASNLIYSQTSDTFMFQKLHTCSYK